MFTFPLRDPNELLIPRGAVYDFVICPYLPNGADGVASPIGTIAAQVTHTHARTMKEIDVQNAAAPIGAFLTREHVTIQATASELTLARYAQLMNMQSTAVTGGGDASASGTLLIGGNWLTDYYQVAMRRAGLPNQPNGTSRVYQFWKCKIAQVAAQVFSRDDFDKLQFTLTAFSDFTAFRANKGMLGQHYDA